MEYKLTNTIRVERARHDITQGELAYQVDCSRVTIHNIERGKYEPKTMLALKIAKYFNKRVEKIFRLEKIEH